MGVYLLVLGYLIWCVYNGDVYPREAAFLVSAVVVLSLIVFAAKLSEACHIVIGVATVIYLVVKSYGGDVKIR